MVTYDPAVFDPAAIAPETARFNAELEATLASTPSILEVPPQVVRQARAEGQTLFGPVVRLPEAEERTISGPAGPIPLRIVRPEHPRGAFLHIHGGGWTLGAHVEREFGGRVLAIGGESAGAHLSTATLLRLRDRHGLMPFRAALLAY